MAIQAATLEETAVGKVEVGSFPAGTLICQDFAGQEKSGVGEHLVVHILATTSNDAGCAPCDTHLPGFSVVYPPLL